MKFPDCTVVSINLPNELLEIIDTHATKRILNRSACVRELVTQALKAPENLKPSIPKYEQAT
ncbi:MAG: ribbon-helix-helix domain-containing protein [Nitrospira sp.]